MAGLMNSSIQDARQSPAPAQTEQIDDPILKQVESQIEQSVPPEMKQQYDAIVVAGMNVMFSKETSHLLEEQLASSNDPVESVSDGVSKLMVMVFNESKQDIKDFAPAAGLACVTLMAQALDYLEQTKGIQVTPEMVAECTKQTMMKTLQKFGISQDQVGQVMAAGQQQGGAVSDQGAQPAQQQPMGV